MLLLLLMLFMIQYICILRTKIEQFVPFFPLSYYVLTGNPIGVQIPTLQLNGSLAVMFPSDKPMLINILTLLITVFAVFLFFLLFLYFYIFGTQGEFVSFFYLFFHERYFLLDIILVDVRSVTQYLTFFLFKKKKNRSKKKKKKKKTIK